MSIDHLTTEAMKLGLKERACLAEVIWASLGEPHTFLSDMCDEKALSLAFQRDTEIDDCKVSALSHAELMERLA